jgi:FkbM family methyltransferase
MSMEGAFLNMKKCGFSPGLIIDVGAAYGDFCRMGAAIFPEADCLMLEPLEEYRPHLEKTVADIPRADCVMAAAGAEPGRRTINVHPDLVGSSFLTEWDEESSVNGKPREVTVTTVDAELEKLKPKGPILLKADVQGAELEVLAGAERSLADCEALILETTLFNSFAGGPLISDVIEFMVRRGFVIYDITGNLYRPLDDALMQVDLIFVRGDSALRRRHAYATPEQRRKQTDLLLARWGN